MRQLTRALVLAGLLLLTGCWPNHGPGTAPLPPPIAKQVPDPDAPTLVSYLNDSAQRVQSLECKDLGITAHADRQQVGLSGVMCCQKPRNLRLQARVLGSPAVDMGSNSEEFWYWISKADPPYLVHCSYQDLGRGGVSLPFPFHPDWVMEALGMAEYNPAGNYQLQVTAQDLNLVEQATSAQGQPVRKVTVVDRVAWSRGQFRVKAHRLQTPPVADGKINDICVAEISEVQYDKNNRVSLPYRMSLSWPAEKIKMDMTLDSVQVNSITPNRLTALFTRPVMDHVQTVDLAHMMMRPTSQVRRASGASPYDR